MKDNLQKITVEPDGPYRVQGSIPLVRKSPVMSEHGETLAWKTEEELTASGVFFLCRCGASRNKPFCDESHEDINFDGTEAADTGSISSRDSSYEGTGITVKDDRSLCMHAGFCGTRVTNVWKMVPQTDDAQIRASGDELRRNPSAAAGDDGVDVGEVAVVELSVRSRGEGRRRLLRELRMSSLVDRLEEQRAQGGQSLDASSW